MRDFSSFLIGCACSLVLTAPHLPAADVHVASNGSDTGSGLIDAPFQTVAHALSQSVAGDRVLLRRGDVFRESGLTVENGRALATYGDPANAAPVLTGSVVVSGWTPSGMGDGVYEAALSASVNKGEPSVFVNGERQTLARFPDTGWLRVKEGTTTNAIVDPVLAQLSDAAADKWNGAQVRWRKWSWWYETRPILDDNGAGVLSLGGSSSIPNLSGIDGGYYIDNHIDALDAPGEWFWNRTAGMLYLIPPVGVDPADMMVEVAIADQALNVRNGAVADGLHIRHYTDTGISVSGASRVENCTIEHVWNRGISGSWGAAGSVVRGNRIRDILNVGINWNENPGGSGGSVIERNVLERIGVIPGLGGSGPWHAAGVIISNAPDGVQKGVQFRLNRVLGTGYAGIILGADGQTVERNVFRHAMSTLNDGAGIYTNCSRSFIRENIILDTEGDLESSHPWTPLGAGIWLEFLEQFRDSEIVANTVYGSGGDGLFLPNNYDCRIDDNVFLSNLRGGMTLGGHENRFPALLEQNHTFTNNLFGIGAVPWSSTGFRNLASWGDRDDVCIIFKVYEDYDIDFGSMSGTTLLTPDGEDWIAPTSGSYLSVAEWQSAEVDWADPSPTVRVGSGYLFINDTESTAQFPLPGQTAWTALDGTPIAQTVSIEPFRSVVLLSANGTIEGLAPYHLYSEINTALSWTEWLSNYALENPATAGAADPDLDGLVNALEYLLMTSPVVANAAPAFDLRVDETGARLVFNLRDHRTAWDLSAEGSQNLSDWQQSSLQPSGDEAPVGASRFFVELDDTSAPFVRLVAVPVTE